MSQASPSEKKLLHYIGKAIHDYNMIQNGDRVLVCLSGGKDSYTLLTLLERMRHRAPKRFSLFSLTLDQAQPGWQDDKLRQWLDEKKIPHSIITRDTYSIVKRNIPPGKTYCSLCSRLRRGIIYRYAEEHGFNKIALGHHRDDLIETLLMSIFYGGHIRAMPAKLLSDTNKHVLIRPMAYCQEADIIQFANEQAFPIIPCNLCGSQTNLARQRIKSLIQTLAQENPKIPSNMLHALKSVRPSQLLDKALFNFVDLEHHRVSDSPDNPEEDECA